MRDRKERSEKERERKRDKKGEKVEEGKVKGAFRVYPEIKSFELVRARINHSFSRESAN